MKKEPAIFSTIAKLEPVYDWMYKIFMFICKILLVADILLTCYAVIGRYVAYYTGYILDTSWSEQLILTCMIYMAVLSAALAIRKGSHIRMTALDSYLPKTLIKVLDVAADIAVIVLGVVMIVYGMDGAMRQMKNNYETIVWLSRFWMYFPIPLAGIAMIVFELECLFRDIRAFFTDEPKKEVQ